MIILGIDIKIYFLLFMFYAFLGWLLEVTCKAIEFKRFINRGFLIGPYCPIYGFGAILITLLLQKYTDDPIVLFCMAIIICGILEYITSYLMEKIYHARWWDYSKRKYNINGRICLNTIIPFGILGLLIMYVTNPFLISIIKSMPELVLNIIFYILLTIFIIDNIISGKIIGTLGKTTRKIGIEFDNTEEITKKVKEVLTDKSALYRRLLKAYPNIQSIKIKIKNTKEDLKKQTEELKEKINRKK